MLYVPRWIHPLIASIFTIITWVADAGRFLRLRRCAPAALAAEVLFLRKQLALYEERQVTPRRATNATRMTMVWLSRFFDWRPALCIVKPDTFTAWHRRGFRLVWRWKSTPGRPALPKDLRGLIRRMALDNPTWGQERIANELLLKLGLRVSPRTVRKYMPRHCVGGPGTRRHSQRWSTFLRNHAQSIVACDCCVVITAPFRMLYVFVVIEHANRRLIHVNVTAHPTAQWTIQQFREAIPADHPYRLVIHDRDAIFSKEVDKVVRHMGLHVLKTPVRTPVAHAICERVIGTIRRECLDFMIPLHARHLSRIVQEWVHHYNTGRPHMSLGPGIPQPAALLPVSLQVNRHRLPQPLAVTSHPILGGLHHAYGLEEQAA